MHEKSLFGRIGRWLGGASLSNDQLRRQWRAALKESSSAGTSGELRAVQQALQSHVTQLPRWYLLFLHDFLRIPDLTEQDLQMVEATGQALAALPSARPRPSEIWSRLFPVRLQRGDLSQALALLSALHLDPAADATTRQQCHQALLQQRLLAENHLRIYQDYLQRSPVPEVATTIFQLLAYACAADFTTSLEQIQQSGRVAHHLRALGQEQVDGLFVTLGVYALKIEQVPGYAAQYFEQALQRQPGNPTAQAGLLACMLQQGTYDAIPHLIRRFGQPLPPAVEHLLLLGQVFTWLESRTPAASPPASAAQLETLQLEKYADDAARFAVGCLYLREGHGSQARHYLLPLLQSRLKQPRWHYYIAWSCLLDNDRRGIEGCLAAVPAFPARWPIAALLLDLAPYLAEQHGLVQHGSIGPALSIAPAYHSAFQFRIAQAYGLRPPAVHWQSGQGTLEEEIEALRSALGDAFYRRDAHTMQDLLSLPLFLHLPRADQLTWQGLHHQLTGNNAMGLALLQQAASVLKYRCAALILATCLLSQHEYNTARDVLAGLAVEREDYKLLLLLSTVEAQAGHIDSAIATLQIVAGAGRPRVSYQLGRLFLQQAKRLWQQGQKTEAQRLFRQAIRCFEDAYRQKDCTLPPGSAQIKPFLQYAPSPPSQKDRVPAEEQPSLFRLWQELLSQLKSNDLATVATACEDLYELLLHLPPLNSASTLALAHLLAQHIPRVQRFAHGRNILELLAYLAHSTQHPAVQRLYGQSVLLLAEKFSPDQFGDSLRSQAETQPENFVITAVYVSINLLQQRRAEAISLLEAARPANSVEQALRNVLLALLTAQPASASPAPGDSLSAQNIPPADLKATPEQVQTLLQMITAFLAGQQDQGYQMLSSLLQEQPGLLLSVFKGKHLSRILRAYSQTGKAQAEHVISFIQNMPDVVVDADLAKTLVHMLLTSDAVERACSLCEWLLVRNRQQADFPLRDFVRFLCYQATQDYRAGRYQDAARRLRGVLTADVPLKERDALPVLIKKLESHYACQRLLNILAQRNVEYQPGRYDNLQLLIGAISGLQQLSGYSSTLSQALQQDDDAAARSAWIQALRSFTLVDLRLWHGLAVLYRELALLNADEPQADLLPASTALWLLLLCSAEFWHYFAQSRVDPGDGTAHPLSKQDQQQLMSAALEHLLAFHRTMGSHNLAVGRHELAGIHLHCLDISRAGNTTPLARALQKQALSYPHSVDIARLQQATTQANRLFEDWYETLLEEAEQFLTHTEDLPAYLRQNYRRGIDHLEPFITQSEKYGIAVPRVLLTCLKWYNNWSDDLPDQKEDQSLISVVRAATPIGDQLAFLCRTQQQQAYRPENQQISRHLVYRALTSSLQEAEYLLQAALAWNRHNETAEELNRAREIIFLLSIAPPSVLPELIRRLEIDPQRIMRLHLSRDRIFLDLLRI